MVSIVGAALSLQPASAQQLPNSLNAPVAEAQYPIMQHKSKIAITRNNVYFFSNFQVILRLDRDGRVLGGETDYSAVWEVSEDWRR